MRLITYYSDRFWPTDHSFIEEVVAAELPKHVDKVEIVLPSRGWPLLQKTQWQGAEVIIVNRHAYFLYSVFTFIVARSRRDAAVVVRNRPCLALMGAAVLHGINYHLSHLIEETHLESMGRANGLRANTRRMLISARKRVRNIVIRRACSVFVVSNWLRQEVIAQTGAKHERIHVVPLGARAVEVKNSIANMRTSGVRSENGPRRVLYAGTLNRARELRFICDVAKKLERRKLNIKFVICGDGPKGDERAELEEYCLNQGIENVYFTGKVSREEVARQIRESDLGLSYFPDREIFMQNSPIKIMEYLAFGLPVVCTNQPEQEYLVERCDGGVIVQHPATVSRFADAVSEALYERSWNPPQISERLLRLRGYDRICKYDFAPYIRSAKE